MSEKEKRKKSSEFSRIEIAYHGKRTDARDRSSEDPIRHTLPRVNLPPKQESAKKSQSPSDEETLSDKSSSKKRSFRSKRSKSKEKERRASRERELERSRGRKEQSPVSMPTTVEMNFEVLRPGVSGATATSTPIKKHDSAENSPVPKKKSSSFQFWREQQLKKAEAKQAQYEASAEARKSDKSHVTVTSLPKKSPKPESVVVKDDNGQPGEKKFGRSTSLSALFSAFSRKKSSTKTDRKFSAEYLVKSSPLSPDFHASLMQGTEESSPSTVSSPPFSPIKEVPDSPKASKSPLQAWRLHRQKDRHEQFREIPPTVPEQSNEGSEADPASFNTTMVANDILRTADPDIPTPDYDQMSVASSNASSFISARYFHNRATDSSMEELRPTGPHYYGYNMTHRVSATALPPQRSSSQFSIPRYAIKTRTRSLFSASPRLEHPSSRSPSTDSIFGGGSVAGSHFGSNDSQIWYQNYQTDAFPHTAVFGAEDFKGHSVDGRINHIKGEFTVES